MLYITYISIKLGGIFSHKMKKYFIILFLWLIYYTFYLWTCGHILEFSSELKWYAFVSLWRDFSCLDHNKFSKLFITHTSHITQLILLDLLLSFLKYFFQPSFIIWSLCIITSKAVSCLKLYHDLAFKG